MWDGALVLLKDFSGVAVGDGAPDVPKKQRLVSFNDIMGIVVGDGAPTSRK